ncbi:hypothetical protein ScalyP_jg7038 [Parmales sp. scaly parma]|nr:hypothetical protein ScalyP_jg7038 [Parmales sp. scaly parma]
MGDVNDGSLQPQVMPAGALELSKQLKQEKINSLQDRVLVLCKQKEFLKTRLEKAETDTHQFVDYFQSQIETKDLINNTLKEETQKNELESKKIVREMKDNTSETIRKVKEEADNNELELRSHLQMAEEELHKLNHFREMKGTVEAQMAELHKTVKSLEEKNQHDLNNQERKFLVEKAKMHKASEMQTEEIRKAARIEAQAGLDSETKKIVSDNRRMGEELRFQLQMMAELQNEKSKSDEMVRQLRREVSIFSEKEKEFAKQGQARANENKKLSNKVMALEEALLAAAKKFKEDRETIKDNVSKELEDATLDSAGMRQLINLKNKELAHVKSLAQTILDQRGEVEQFFLESIEQVKEKKLEERESNYRKSMVEYNKKMREAGERGGGKFPRIRGRNLSFLDQPAESSKLPVNPSKKVDLGDLTWEDRERVLRLLFAKINNVQGEVEGLPNHQLEEVGDNMIGSVPSTANSGYRTVSRPEN